ncbi:hypothetical protein LWI29_032465 [Acer saccharum]|uniref:ATP-dependent Clp protease proteolytic subunit n=1 Tax=Acer saccharum TaxID=4024 RepID=A0AA39VPN4_ACESA|nr:hypothetical protein LWI29_032465 [Acer saccharum]
MMPIGTPKVSYRTPSEGTWQWVDLWNALYRERVLFIGQNIDEEFSNQLLATMLYLDSLDDSKRIYTLMVPVEILAGEKVMFFSALEAKLITFCGSTTFMTDGEDHHFAMPLSRIALQSPAGAARGQADDIRNEANELIRIKDYLYGELAKKTGQPLEKINQDLRRMKRFNAEEALEYGLIDRIVRPHRIKADAPRKEASTGLG